jgi:regulator of protease activity HflC (stomatin/prohibitin superfamily)
MRERKPLNIKRTVILCILALFLLITVFNCFVTVQSGTVGVVSTMGAVSAEPMTAGFHFKAPYFSSVTKMDIKTEKAEAVCAAASIDLQTITATVVVNYHVNQDSAPTLFKTVGKGYQDIVIVPAIQESVKAVSAQYSAEQLITLRQEVSIKISDMLAKKIGAYGFTIEQFNITNLDFSAAFNQAIEAKQTAQQAALKAQQDLARIEIEAKQTVTQAQAQADATKAAADAQAYSIKVIQDQLSKGDSNYIGYLNAQKWNGQYPSTYVAGSGTDVFASLPLK